MYTETTHTVFFLSWEAGVSYCVHNVTTAVCSTRSMETLCSGHIMYTIGHTYFPKSLDRHLVCVCIVAAHTYVRRWALSWNTGLLKQVKTTKATLT